MTKSSVCVDVVRPRLQTVTLDLVPSGADEARTYLGFHVFNSFPSTENHWRSAFSSDYYYGPLGVSGGSLAAPEVRARNGNSPSSAGRRPGGAQPIGL